MKKNDKEDKESEGRGRLGQRRSVRGQMYTHAFTVRPWGKKIQKLKREKTE